MLALAVLVWLLSPLGDRPARAMGCHVPDRPVLGMDKSEGAGTHVAAWAMIDPNPAAPPVLSRVPCPGETPQVPVVPVSQMGAACLARLGTMDETPVGSFHTVEAVDRLYAHPFRLDRPPR